MAAISLFGGYLLSRSYDKKQENQTLFILSPFFLKNFTREFIMERSRELQVGKHSVSLGTTAIKLATYKGEQPFLIKTPQGEPITQINPGDQLGHLHVFHQAALMRNLSPLEKAEQITGDFIELFKGSNGNEKRFQPLLKNKL